MYQDWIFWYHGNNHIGGDNMLEATPTNGFFKGRPMRAHGIVNRGGWFGKNWLVVVTIANALHAAIIVEAEHEPAVIDELADSHWSHLIDQDECLYCGTRAPFCDCDSAEYAGNDSHRIDTSYVTVLERCKVDYFAKDPGGWH
jgi:hypothetical protein